MKHTKFIAVFLILLLLGSLSAQTKPVDSEDFLEDCRKHLLGNCWIKLSGQVFIRKGGVRVKPMPLKCAAQLIPNKIVFKATIQKTQSFKVEHDFQGKHDVKVLEDKLGDDDGFKKIGLRPIDLSLAFMYWDYIKEYPKDGLGAIGTVKCRVFLLADPDSKEFVKVWLSERFKAPLQVQWFKDLKKEPVKQLEFKDFAEKNKVWVPLEMKVSTEKGELQVKFDKEKIEAAFSKVAPKDLYQTEN